MRATVITYGGPAVYARCSDAVSYKTRKVKYVTTNAYHTSAPRYVAVRSSKSYYPTVQTRYVAVRNIDRDNAPRYVTVRRAPAYVDTGARYVMVRNDYVPRTKYVAVRNVDLDEVVYDHVPRYVALRSAVYNTGPRVVAVRNIVRDYDAAPTKYVAVRNNACACDVSDLDQVETTSIRHVVVKTDHLTGTQEVIVPQTSYDDTAYVAMPSASVNGTYVSHNDNDIKLVPASYIDAKTVRYVPTIYDDDDVDIDDTAILDTSDATFVAADDIEDACLSPVAVQASPMVLKTRAVSYVPIDDADEYASFNGSEPVYVVATNTVSYVPVVEDDEDLIDDDVGYIAPNDAREGCGCPVETVSYTEADEMDVEADTPVAAVENTSSEIDVETIHPQVVAGDSGYRDGFEDGKVAALNNDEYRPENSMAFQDASNGYEGTFGDKDVVYTDAYRDSYLQGYSAGFSSVTGV